jgi:hypothetical protein
VRTTAAATVKQDTQKTSFEAMVRKYNTGGHQPAQFVAGAHRCAADCCDPPRLESMVGGGKVPAGPVLPAKCVHHPPPALARAGRRSAAPGAALPPAL